MLICHMEEKVKRREQCVSKLSVNTLHSLFLTLFVCLVTELNAMLAVAMLVLIDFFLGKKVRNRTIHKRNE